MLINMLLIVSYLPGVLNDDALYSPGLKQKTNSATEVPPIIIDYTDEYSGYSSSKEDYDYESTTEAITITPFFTGDKRGQIPKHTTEGKNYQTRRNYFFFETVKNRIHGNKTTNSDEDLTIQTDPPVPLVTLPTDTEEIQAFADQNKGRNNTEFMENVMKKLENLSSIFNTLHGNGNNSEGQGFRFVVVKAGDIRNYTFLKNSINKSETASTNEDSTFPTNFSVPVETQTLGTNVIQGAIQENEDINRTMVIKDIMKKLHNQSKEHGRKNNEQIQGYQLFLSRADEAGHHGFIDVALNHMKTNITKDATTPTIQEELLPFVGIYQQATTQENDNDGYSTDTNNLPNTEHVKNQETAGITETQPRNESDWLLLPGTAKTETENEYTSLTENPAEMSSDLYKTTSSEESDGYYIVSEKYLSRNTVEVIPQPHTSDYLSPNHSDLEPTELINIVITSQSEIQVRTSTTQIDAEQNTGTVTSGYAPQRQIPTMLPIHHVDSQEEIIATTLGLDETVSSALRPDIPDIITTTPWAKDETGFQKTISITQQPIDGTESPNPREKSQEVKTITLRTTGKTVPPTQKIVITTPWPMDETTPTTLERGTRKVITTTSPPIHKNLPSTPRGETQAEIMTTTLPVSGTTVQILDPDYFTYLLSTDDALSPDDITAFIESITSTKINIPGYNSSFPSSTSKKEYLRKKLLGLLQKNNALRKIRQAPAVVPINNFDDEKKEHLILTFEFGTNKSTTEWFVEYDGKFKKFIAKTLNLCSNFRKWNGTFLPKDILNVAPSPFQFPEERIIKVSIAVINPLKENMSYIPASTVQRCVLNGSSISSGIKLPLKSIEIGFPKSHEQNMMEMMEEGMTRKTVDVNIYILLVTVGAVFVVILTCIYKRKKMSGRFRRRVEQILSEGDVNATAEKEDSTTEVTVQMPNELDDTSSLLSGSNGAAATLNTVNASSTQKDNKKWVAPMVDVELHEVS